MSTSASPSSFTGLYSSMASNKSSGPRLAQGPTSEQIQSRFSDHLHFAPILITVSLPSLSCQCSQSASFNRIAKSAAIPSIFSSRPCCCLPTPMTLASGGSPMFPLVVHQPASPSIWPAVQSLRRGLSTNPGVTMWCVCGCS